METYKLLTEAIGLITTPAIIVLAIGGIIRGLQIYHRFITKKIVLEYLKTLQK